VEKAKNIVRLKRSTYRRRGGVGETITSQQGRANPRRRRIGFHIKRKYSERGGGKDWGKGNPIWFQREDTPAAKRLGKKSRRHGQKEKLAAGGTLRLTLVKKNTNAVGGKREIRKRGAGKRKDESGLLFGTGMKEAKEEEAGGK